jgi:hypothetical protein
MLQIGLQAYIYEYAVNEHISFCVAISANAGVRVREVGVWFVLGCCFCFYFFHFGWLEAKQRQRGILARLANDTFLRGHARADTHKHTQSKRKSILLGESNQGAQIGHSTITAKTASLLVSRKRESQQPVFPNSNC